MSGGWYDCCAHLRVSPTRITRSPEPGRISAQHRMVAIVIKQTLVQWLFGGSIHYLAEIGDVQKARRMLAADPLLVNAIDKSGCTPLHWATTQGVIPMLYLLLANGAELNAQDEQGLAPLHKAVITGRTEVVELLLKHGADVNLADYDGTLPVQLAVAWGQGELVNLLLAHGADAAAADILVTEDEELLVTPTLNTPLHEAAWHGDREEIFALLRQGADVNARGEEGWTPLHITAADGDWKIACLLLSRGADPNARAHDGRAPLHWAVMGSHYEVVQVLLAAGADVNARSDDGMTAIQWPRTWGDTTMGTLLHSYGAVE